MPMPTTRRGRYLVYKERALKRRNREWSRYPSPNPKRNRITSRQREWTLWGKQVPKSYPRYVYGVPSGLPWDLSVSFTKPERGVFGVFPAFPFFTPVPPGVWHRDFAIVGYQKRRVWSIPRARLREWKGYLKLREDVTADECYPFLTYPSGEPTLYSELT